MQCILLPLAQGRLLRDGRGHTPSMYVEAAHEALLDFCLFPGALSMQSALFHVTAVARSLCAACGGQRSVPGALHCVGSPNPFH
jgi:hypothetical protein